MIAILFIYYYRPFLRLSRRLQILIRRRCKRARLPN